MNDDNNIQPISQLAVDRAKQFTHKFIFDRKKELNLSNYMLAKLAGMNRQILDTYEKDYKHNLTIDSYYRICGALKLRPYLIAAEDDKETFHFEHFN